MKETFFIVWMFTICSFSYGQVEKLFEVNEIFIEDSTQSKTEQDFQKQDSVFFEDEDYLVRKTCSGEWGGTIWFKNKKTGIEYSCEATCPVVVNKVNGKYIVTSTLAHLWGSSEVIEIDDPESLSVFKLPKPKYKKGKTRVYMAGDDESKSKQGTNKLLDSIGILTIASFPLDGQLFHIVTNWQGTFIAKIENQKFVTLDTISNKYIMPNYPEVIKTVDGHYIVFFSDEQVKGYLDIYRNKIILIRYK